MGRRAIEMWPNLPLAMQANLAPPGVVFLPWWRPDSPADVDGRPERFSTYA